MDSKRYKYAILKIGAFDCHPYEIIKETKYTKLIRRMKCTLISDPPKTIHEGIKNQQWKVESDAEGALWKVRKKPNGTWGPRRVWIYMSSKPTKYISYPSDY